jgi:hypothetical protein
MISFVVFAIAISCVAAATIIAKRYGVTPDTTSTKSTDAELIPLVLTVATAVVGMFTILMRYLQSSKFSKGSSDSSSYLFDSRLRALESQTSRRSDAEVAFTDEERKVLVTEIFEKAKSTATSQLFDEIKAGLKSQEIFDVIEKAFKATYQRLGEEVEALGTRANLNLVIGIITSAIGVSLLAFVVFTADNTSKDPSLIAVYYLPRLSVVLFIELFAYFFLKLYKLNLAEIKYFQNELTNVESKFAALRVAATLQEDGTKVHADVIRNLAATERNFVLKKGETTPDIEKAKLDGQKFSEVAKTLGEILNRK